MDATFLPTLLFAKNTEEPLHAKLNTVRRDQAEFSRPWSSHSAESKQRMIYIWSVQSNSSYQG